MDPMRKCQVHLTDDHRRDLQRIARDGQTPARKARYARLLLHADEDHPEGRRNDAWIGQALGMHVNTVARVRKHFAAGGLDAAFGRKARETPPVPPQDRRPRRGPPRRRPLRPAAGGPGPLDAQAPGR